MLFACGGSSGNSTNTVVPLESDKVLVDAYSLVLEKFKTYDIKKAVLSTRLQEAGPNLRDELQSLDDDWKMMNALLSMLYEMAYRPGNFSKSQLSMAASNLGQNVQQYKTDYPFPSGVEEARDEESDYRASRDAFLEQVLGFQSALSENTE